MNVLKIKRLPHALNLELPSYVTPQSAGMDLRAALTQPVVIKPGERTLIPTGLIFEIPEGFEIQVRPRSGLAIRNGITMLNTPGTIDSDYRGEVKMIVINLGKEDFIVEHGDRIAQCVVAPVVQLSIQEVDSVSETPRGTGGFGSTGKK